MISPIDNKQYNVYNNFKSSESLKTGGLRSYRYHTADYVEMSTKVNSGIGAVAGTLIPMFLFGKSQGKNLFKLEYGIKEMLGITAGSIAGGVIGGITGDKSRKKNKEKINEGIFQFMNAVVPGVLVVGMLELTKKHKSLDTKTIKGIGTILSVGLGAIGAAKLSNIICDPFDKVPDRKLTAKDSIANIDDAIGALVLAKFPVIDKLHVDKLLPAIYAWCGYRAGQAN